MASYVLRPWNLSIKFCNVSEKPLDLNLMPMMPLICDVTIIIDVAVVKPETTGVDINSTRNP